MKLRIELDIEPSEVKLVEELLSTIRRLTENVKVNIRTGSSKTLSASDKQVNEPTKTLTSTAPAPAPTKGQISPRPEQQKPLRASSNGNANGWAPNHVDPTASRLDAPFDFKAALSELEAAVKVDSPRRQTIAQQIIAALPPRLDTSQQEAIFQAFSTAFEAALWRSQAVENSPTLDLCFMLPRIPSPLLEELKKSIISKAMKHLMIKRPLNVDRLEFFSQAETFAAMVKLEFVLMPGAIQTIMQLLKREDTCAAAITMLGKTVELCAAELKDQCEPSKLEALRATLEGTQYDEIDYDKQYIMSTMGWEDTSQQQNQAAAAGPGTAQDRAPLVGAAQPSRSLPSLEPLAIWSDYTSQVRAVCLDDENQQVMSITGDGFLYLHSFQGQELAKYNIKQRSYAAMDFNSTSRILVLAANPAAPREAANPAAPISPLFAAYKVQPKSLQPLGRRAAHDRAASVSKLRYLAKGSDKFFAVEETSGMQHSICLYDSGSVTGSGDETLTPLQSLQSEQITAASNVPASDQAFLTADKSGAVSVWQVNVDRPAAVLEAPEKDQNAPNASVITCLDVLANHLVVAGTYGQGINIWDLRGLQKSTRLKPCANIRLDEYSVTRLASFGEASERLCMVAATQTIRTVRLHEDGTLAEQREGQKASDKFYFDAKWSSASAGNALLFAASAAGSLDVYSAN